MQNLKKKVDIKRETENRRYALVPVIKGGRTVSRRLLRQMKKKKKQHNFGTQKIDRNRMIGESK